MRKAQKLRNAPSDKSKKIRDSQQKQWEKTFSDEPDFFGEEPSYPARAVARDYYENSMCYSP
jgi:hypothetical protein